MIRVGIVGAGFMGRMHGEIYKLLPDAKVVAVADLFEEKAREVAQPHGGEVYSSGEDLIQESDVDMVDICLPTYLHSKHAIDAARRGRHILCEKPMALNIHQAEDMIESARSSSVKMMIAHCIRFWPEYKLLKEYIDSEKLGRLTSLFCSRVSGAPSWSWEGWILDEKRSGGAILDLHIHDTDFILYLFGRPRSVYSTGCRGDIGIYHVFTIYEYLGRSVSAEGGWYSPEGFPFNMAYRAVFEKGVIAYSIASDPTILIYERGKDPYKPDLEVPQVGPKDAGGNISNLGGYLGEIEYFLRCLREGGEPTLLTPEDAKLAVEVVCAEIQSVNSGYKVEL